MIYLSAAWDAPGSTRQILYTFAPITGIIRCDAKGPVVRHFRRYAGVLPQFSKDFDQTGILIMIDWDSNESSEAAVFARHSLLDSLSLRMG
jgi:hypothetical protein